MEILDLLAVLHNPEAYKTKIVELQDLLLANKEQEAKYRELQSHALREQENLKEVQKKIQEMHTHNQQAERYLDTKAKVVRQNQKALVIKQNKLEEQTQVVAIKFKTVEKAEKEILDKTNELEQRAAQLTEREKQITLREHKLQQLEHSIKTAL